MNKKHWIIGGSILGVLLLIVLFIVFATIRYNNLKKPIKPGITEISKQKIAIIYHPYNEGIIQVADLIRSKVGGTVYLIEPTKPYPTKKIDHARIKKEQEHPENLALKKYDIDLKRYHIIFLGVPVIDSNISPVMMKYLLDNETSFVPNQIIIPFIYYNGQDNTIESDKFIYYHTGRTTKKNGYRTSNTDKEGNNMYITLWLNDISFYRYELK